MTSVNYVPARDGDYNIWVDQFALYLSTNYAALGVSSGDAANMTALATSWDTAYAAAIGGSTRGPMTVNIKDTARANATAFARALANTIQANAGVTEDQKVALGITVRKTTKTPVPAPTTSPILSFIAATPLQHTLRFADQLTPASRSLPFGAIALELRGYVGIAPPIDSTLSTFVQTCTKNPVAVDFTLGQVGKNCYYYGYWRTRTGLLGPISNLMSSAIV